jgi:hypothetical protein
VKTVVVNIDDDYFDILSAELFVKGIGVLADKVEYTPMMHTSLLISNAIMEGKSEVTITGDLDKDRDGFLDGQGDES